MFICMVGCSHPPRGMSEVSGREQLTCKCHIRRVPSTELIFFEVDESDSMGMVRFDGV